MDHFALVLSFISTHWFAVLLALCISMLYCWGVAPFRRSAIVAVVGDLPGPTTLPFVGNTIDMIKFKGQMHLQFDDYYKKYGRLFTMCFFSRKPAIVISDPDMIKELLVKEFHSFHSRPSEHSIRFPAPYDSTLTSAAGDTWHRLRTTLSPTFSSHKMKVMVPMLNNSCDVLKKKLDHVTQTGETVDIYKFLQGLTLEAILATFFGIDSNIQNDYDDPAFVAAREIFYSSPLWRVVMSMVMRVPGVRYLVMKCCPNRVLGPFVKLITWTKNIIDIKKKENKSISKDFLDMMLANTENENLPEDKRLTEHEVIAQSLVFLLAGYETTSNTLALTCHHLATSPDIQDKVQREIDDIWSDEDELPSYDMVQSMTYLDMVISETLRLYPPGFALSRVCARDCTIKGHPIKKDTMILSLVYSIHRDPQYYPDPERFDPERFSAEAKQSRDPYTYLPFGHGPRNCIGMRFAQFEMKMMLARILKTFSLVVAPETKIPADVCSKSVLGCGREGIKLRVKRR
ncbi:hypothetical protein QZH41_019943 [Actinostola sp. cb2023]|nr:hypothetical protein QZH41_019943 [Actinostola sp. cb2023]